MTFAPATRQDKRENSAFKATAPAQQPLNAGDFIAFAALALTLLTLSFLQARGKMFWGDEIMGNYVLHAGSWHRFLQLWNQGIDSSGLWFYIFAKPWEWIVGVSQLRLRMFSALGIIVSAAFIWAAARRFFSAPVVGLAVAVPYLTLSVLRWQLANARCYGVLMAATAAVIYLIVAGENERFHRPSIGFLVATFFAYDVLTGSHILGVVFASALLSMQVAIDLSRRRFRLKLYIAAIAGIILILLLSLKNLRSTTALGKPVFWTQQPQFRALWFGTETTLGFVEATILVLVVLAFVRFRRAASRHTIYFFLLGFFCLHTAFVLISQRATSIYVDRYMLPMAFALVLLIAELLTQIKQAAEANVWRFWFIYAAVCLVPVIWAPRPSTFSLPMADYTDAMLAGLPKGLPVVDTDIGTFVDQEYYHHGHFGRPFLFPLDAEVTNDSTNPGGVSGFHEMDNFAKVGLNSPDLQPTRGILQRYPEFVVITAPAPTSWFSKRIQHDPGFKVTDLGLHVYGIVPVHFWLVQRINAADAKSEHPSA